MLNPQSQTIKAVCDYLLAGNARAAAEMAGSSYPYVPTNPSVRNRTEAECVRVFIRDGFIDRYTGAQLVFPGALRLVSRLLPEQFPFHPNWKMTETHAMYWDLYPTIDHVIPIARGGQDTDSNRITTSMLRNSAKSNWTLDELGWQLLPPGDFQQWNGLTSWFVELIRQEPIHLSEKSIRIWHRTLTEALADRKGNR